VEATRSYGFDRGAFDEVHDWVEAGLLTQTVRLLQLVPLLGFETALHPQVTLASGLVIRLMEDAEVSAALQTGLPDQATSSATGRTVPQAYQRALVKVSSYPVRVGEVPGPVEAPVSIEEEALRLQIALRLVCGGSVTLGRPLQMQHPGDFDADRGYSASLTRVEVPDENRLTILYSPGQVAEVEEMMVTATFDDWHYLTQVNQVRAIATGVAHWRSHWPVCAGTVVWQLNDCWPVTSWAAIDGAARPKPLYHELRRLYADRLLTFQTREGCTVVAVDNQSPQVWESVVVARRVQVDGSVLAEEELAFSVPPRSVALLPLPDGLTELKDPARELLAVEADGLRDFSYACEDRDFAFPDSEMTLDVVTAGTTLEVVITAHTFLRDLLLQADRLAPDAVADRGLITLLPGDRATITVTGLNGVAPDASAVRAAIFTAR
jgi:hypothetical protein